MIREITSDEEVFFIEHGWVMLKALIDPQLCQELLEKGSVPFAVRAENAEVDSPHKLAVFQTSEHFEPILSNPILCQNIQRLMGRKRLADADAPVRYRNDKLLCKAAGGSAIRFHQDSCEQGADRVGELQLWISLAESTPDMGTMRFLSGSHREGPLGCVTMDDGKHWESLDLLDRYPKLTEIYEMTSPIHYQTGDATVHHGFMVHGSAPNMTSHPRVSYIVTYAPADARYWESNIEGPTGSRRTEPPADLFPILLPGN